MPPGSYLELIRRETELVEFFPAICQSPTALTAHADSQRMEMQIHLVMGSSDSRVLTRSSSDFLIV